MASRKPVKPYAVELVKAFRQDAKTITGRVPTAVDLADVIAVKPQVIISPQNAIVEYDEDYLIFQIDPESLEVDDVVVMGRTPSGQPIVLGLADWSNPDPFLDPDLAALKSSHATLKKNTGHIKPSVRSVDELPNDGNDHGDTIIVQDDNSIQVWNGEDEVWEPAINAAPDPALTINTDLVLNELNSMVLVDTSASPVSVTLPSNHVNGKLYHIKDKFGNAGTNNITVLSADGDTIDGLAAWILNVNWQVLTLVSDGSNWSIMGIWP